MSLWPSQFLSTTAEIPDSMHLVANVCRSEWSPLCGTPASLSRVYHLDCNTLGRVYPPSSSAINGLSSPKYLSIRKALIISIAVLFKGTVRKEDRSLMNVPKALPYLSRAFFFDNSGEEMRYLACFSAERGLETHAPAEELPRWFARHILHCFQK